MRNDTFAMPVTILVGLGFPCKIRTAKAALAYLDDRPMCERDEAWDAAVATCRDALAGKACAAEAGNVFTAYARRRDILVEDTIPMVKRDRVTRTGT